MTKLEDYIFEDANISVLAKIYKKNKEEIERLYSANAILANTLRDNLNHVKNEKSVNLRVKKSTMKMLDEFTIGNNYDDVIRKILFYYSKNNLKDKIKYGCKN